MTDNLNKRKQITQSVLIEEYKFTKKLIKDFLPEPECKPNPHYKKAAPMKLWYEDEVLEIIKTQEFVDALKKTEKRRKSAQKAVNTKKQKTEESLHKFIKSIEVYVNPSKKGLETLTLNAKQSWYDYTENYYQNAYDADELTKQRWMVNFIRHNYVNYDEYLYSLYNKVGKVECYVKAKIAVLEKIAEAYPYLAEECDRQMYGYKIK